MAVITRRNPRTRQRGFTLPELMAVVAIMGLLATIALSKFSGQMRASKTGEATAVVQAIRAAEERYRSENQVYLADDSTTFYPTSGVGDTRASFTAPSHTDYAAIWQKLKPTVDRPVGFGYR